MAAKPHPPLEICRHEAPVPTTFTGFEGVSILEVVPEECQGTKFHPKLDSGASAITPGGISLIFKAKKSTLFSSRFFYGILSKLTLDLIALCL